MARPAHTHDVGAIAQLADEAVGNKQQQIRQALLGYIADSQPGHTLPSERVLAEALGVARMTVRSSLVDLEQQGFVRRVPGRGTFVESRHGSHSTEFRSFSQDMRRRGFVPSTSGLTIRTRVADASTAEQLDLRAGDMVIDIERVRLADDAPMAVERATLPAARFPRLEAEFGPDDSLYEVLRVRYDAEPVSADQHVTVAMLEPADAARLGVDAGDAAFRIARWSRDSSGAVIEYGESLYRADRYEIYMRVGAARPSPDLHA